MKLFLLSLCFLMLTGCAFLERVAPSAIDEQGQPIPGTHEALPIVDQTANAVPWGGFGLTFLLAIWNGVEIFKKNKIAKGFKATVQAIELASKDPLMREVIQKLKEKLSEAHQLTDTQKEVNSLLSKLKF